VLVAHMAITAWAFRFPFKAGMKACSDVGLMLTCLL
jgi:hypothetical protein